MDEPTTQALIKLSVSRSLLSLACFQTSAPGPVPSGGLSLATTSQLMLPLGLEFFPESVRKQLRGGWRGLSFLKKVSGLALQCRHLGAQKKGLTGAGEVPARPQGPSQLEPTRVQRGSLTHEGPPSSKVFSSFQRVKLLAQVTFLGADNVEYCCKNLQRVGWGGGSGEPSLHSKR